MPWRDILQPVGILGPERLAEPQVALVQHTHAELGNRIPHGGRQLRYEAHPPGLQHAERQGHSDLVSHNLRLRRYHRHRRRVPSKLRYWPAIFDVDSTSQVLRHDLEAFRKQGIVAAELLVAVVPLRGELCRAPRILQLELGAHKKTDEVVGVRIRIELAQQRLQCPRNRKVGAPVLRLLERRDHPAPEIRHPLLLSSSERPAGAVIGKRVVVAGDRTLELLPVRQHGQGIAVDAMNPGRAEIDRRVRPACAGPDAPAAAVARFDHHDIMTGPLQFPRRRQPRQPGADHNNPSLARRRRHGWRVVATGSTHTLHNGGANEGEKRSSIHRLCATFVAQRSAIRRPYAITPVSCNRPISSSL